MNKKTITIAILAVFLTATLLPGLVIAQKSATVIEALPQTIDKPLSPEDTEEVEITVKYKLDVGPFLFWFYTQRRIGRMLLFGFGKGYFFKFLVKPPTGVKIPLNVEHPDWCTATLEPSNVTLPIKRDFNSATATLTISDIQPDAPALELDDIIIKANFGGLGRIKPSADNITISIMAAYLPNITFVTEETQYNISPINETIIPIDVKNEGNGESTISIELEEFPENWKNVSLDKEEITLDVDATETILLYVTPVKTFDNGTVKLKFTPMSTTEEDVDDEYKEGDPVYLSIVLLNDGSLKEEKGELPILEIVIIIIVAAVIILLILLFLFRRR